MLNLSLVGQEAPRVLPGAADEHCGVRHATITPYTFVRESPALADPLGLDARLACLASALNPLSSSHLMCCVNEIVVLFISGTHTTLAIGAPGGENLLCGTSRPWKYLTASMALTRETPKSVW